MSQDDFQGDFEGAAAPARDVGDAALPPVQPPSAGFIVQLFVVPALIVLAVVAVWAMFGKIASSEEDWRELVEDIRNTNEHRRWRGAYGLATLLERDQQLAGNGQHLSSNPEIARALVGLFEEGLARHSQREDDLKQEAFLARTLGLLDARDSVLPALQHGMTAQNDREVRKNSLASVAVIAFRGSEREKPVTSTSLVDDLVRETSDGDSVIRDTATYALGLVPTDASRNQLALLLSNGDANTRVNAAVGLARQHSTAGFPVFTAILRGATELPADAKSQQMETLLAVKDTLLAVRLLAGEWTPAQRAELAALVDPVSKNSPEPRIRTDAAEALIALRKL